jgi:hypothetical protein
MTMLFCDSFDHYASADIFSKWSSSNFLGAWSIAAAAARSGAGGLRNSNQQHIIGKTFSARATYIVGMAVRFAALPNNNLYRVIALTDAGTLQCDVRISTVGILSVTRNGTVLGTGTAVLQPNVWYYIEFKCTISDAAGVAVVRVNGVTDINLSSVDTKNTANATADQVQLGGGGPSVNANVDWDDLYINDNAGSTNNDFLGDVRVEAIFPSGNGNSSVLVGSDGNSTDNYLLVDEAAPNGDTDYVESSTVGDKDTYAYGNMATTAGTVFAVQTVPYARKTDAGVRSIVSVARLSATETDGPAQTLSTTYQYLPDIRETKPGGGAWTITDVNNVELGTKVAS